MKNTLVFTSHTLVTRPYLMGGIAVQIGYLADLSPYGHILCIQILSRRICDC